MIPTLLTKQLKQGFIISQEDFFLAIKDNNKRKTACESHRFLDIPKDDSFSHTYKYQCENCGCLCDEQYKSAYEFGFEHGSRGVK